MKVSRRLFLIGSAIASSVFYGCATSALFKHEEYSEHITSIFISADQRKLIVITERYHYIFDAPQAIVSTLQSQLSSAVQANFYHENNNGFFSDTEISRRRHDFYVDSSGNVEGDYTLRLIPPASSELVSEAKRLGYQFNVDSMNCWTQSGRLAGKRYSSGGIRASVLEHKLKKPIDLFIEAEQSTSNKILKAPLTPITVAADGALVLISIPLIPLALLVVLKGRAVVGMGR